MENSKQKSKKLATIPDEQIVGKIYYIRGQKMMFDRDLAELYGVETRTLNQAVKRNSKRFPEDFMFQLNKSESDACLRSQIVILDKNLKSRNVTSKEGRGKYSKFLPYVFTEQGVAMLASMLNSSRAIAVNIQIVRTFVKLRQMLSTNKELREKIETMERKYDNNFKVVFQAMARLMREDAIPKEKMGF